MNTDLKVVVSGSFRKHLNQIRLVINNFRTSGVFILAPETSEMTSLEKEFVVLVSDDPTKKPNELENDFLKAIARADFLYVVDVDGYIGYSVASEIAYARLNQIPIIISESIKGFGPEVSEEIQLLLVGSVVSQMPAEQIAHGGIDSLKLRLVNFQYKELSEKERFVLSSLVDSLINNLTKI